MQCFLLINVIIFLLIRTSRLHLLWFICHIYWGDHSNCKTNWKCGQSQAGPWRRIRFRVPSFVFCSNMILHYETGAILSSSSSTSACSQDPYRDDMFDSAASSVMRKRTVQCLTKQLLWAPSPPASFQVDYFTRKEKKRKEKHISFLPSSWRPQDGSILAPPKPFENFSDTNASVWILLSTIQHHQRLAASDNKAQSSTLSLILQWYFFTSLVVSPSIYEQLEAVKSTSSL